MKSKRDTKRKYKRRNKKTNRKANKSSKRKANKSSKRKANKSSKRKANKSSKRQTKRINKNLKLGRGITPKRTHQRPKLPRRLPPLPFNIKNLRRSRLGLPPQPKIGELRPRSRLDGFGRSNRGKLRRSARFGISPQTTLSYLQAEQRKHKSRERRRKKEEKVHTEELKARRELAEAEEKKIKKMKGIMKKFYKKQQTPKSAARPAKARSAARPAKARSASRPARSAARPSRSERKVKPEGTHLINKEKPPTPIEEEEEEESSNSSFSSDNEF